MRRVAFGLIGLLFSHLLFSQKKCGSFEYQQQLVEANPSLETSLQVAANFVHLYESARSESLPATGPIVIPVVVHILYHYPAENLPDYRVNSQIQALNRDYRKQNADTIKIPAAFKSRAADCNIEFRLATVDPQGRATTGIVHKYTPITNWMADDKVKSSAEMGDDGWDPASYLNIWVCRTTSVLGYSSVPGDPVTKDGVVIANRAFGILNGGNYDQGRTAVHEIGHWLGLKHLWGDADCGDDGVADTPKQETFTNGCPTGVRISCNNGPAGDMYMDYMDFTNDDCLVMFTKGQKQKMLALFNPGGPRYSILSSKGLGTPSSQEIPLPDNPPEWLYTRIYPNPANNELIVDVEYDARWIGRQLVIVNEMGQIQIQQIITSSVQRIDISRLKPGMYFITGQKQGDKIQSKFIKL